MENIMNKQIIIGSDHGGYDLKEALKVHIKNWGYEVLDIGTNSTESCDYPLIAQEACGLLLNKKCNAILICGTGIGMSIAANKINGIRAAVVSDTCSAKYSKLHNNANILCLGARIIGEELAKDIAQIWLNTEFEKGRHEKRLKMLE